MNENFPSILEGFYSVGEYFDKENIQRVRRIDAEVWSVKKQRSTNNTE